MFSCVCAVVRATQDQEKHFDALIWADSVYDKPPKDNGSGGGASVLDKTSVLALLLDLSREYEFEVSPPYFKSTQLRPPRPPPVGASSNPSGTAGNPRRIGAMTASSMLSQSSLAMDGGDSLAPVAGVGNFAGVGQNVGAENSDGARGPTEDSRETYSSQTALAEPRAVSTGGEGTASQRSSSQSGDDGESQEEGGARAVSPMFGPGSKGFAGAGGRTGGGGDDEGEGGDGEESLVLEMSHVNREPCMRSLLLVVEAERRMFEEGWREKHQESQGV